MIAKWADHQGVILVFESIDVDRLIATQIRRRADHVSVTTISVRQIERGVVLEVHGVELALRHPSMWVERP
jgi:hypothetical protein